jgi:hypothetical protein
VEDRPGASAIRLVTDPSTDLGRGHNIAYTQTSAPRSRRFVIKFLFVPFPSKPIARENGITPVRLFGNPIG